MKQITKQITKQNVFLLIVLALSISLVLTGTVGLVTHAQTSSDEGTVIAITPSGGATFSGTGWNPQSYSVNTQSIMNDQNIYIQVQGTASGDQYPRFLVVSVNGQVVNSQPLSAGSFGDGIGAYYTDIVQGSFNVQYPVTSYVQGKSISIVLIGLTTWSGPLDGLWNVQANFIGIPNSNPSITIPIGGSSSSSSSTSSSTSTSSSSTSSSTPSTTSSSSSSSSTPSSGGITETSTEIIIPLSELLGGLGLLSLVGAIWLKDKTE